MAHLPQQRSDIWSENSHNVQVKRSARRRRTVSAYRDGDTVVVLIPDKFSAAQEREWVKAMLQRLDSKRSSRLKTDAQLTKRAQELVQRYLTTYLDPALPAVSIRWVSNQRERWGSCTPTKATIRLSDRLLGMPEWVIDYVLIHELAHLTEPNHTAKFWRIVNTYPQAQRARGFLEGIAAASRSSST